MGRELRRVPKDWKHPTVAGKFVPMTTEQMDALLDGYERSWPRMWFQMYEDTSEGTPISPPMPSPEALARWLADSGASAFGNDTATYDQWLATIKQGWAPSAVISSGRLQSGVAETAKWGTDDVG